MVDLLYPVKEKSVGASPVCLTSHIGDQLCLYGREVIYVIIYITCIDTRTGIYIKSGILSSKYIASILVCSFCIEVSGYWPVGYRD